MTVGDEGIVNGLDVRGVEPDRGTNAGLSNGCEIGAGNDVAECERDRLRFEDDGVRTSGLGADEAEVLLVAAANARRGRATHTTALRLTQESG